MLTCWYVIEDINTIYIHAFIPTSAKPLATDITFVRELSPVSKKLVYQPVTASLLKSRFDDPESIKTSKSRHGRTWAFQMSSHQNVHLISFVFFGFCVIFKCFIFLLRVFHLFCLFCVFRLFRLFRLFHFREPFGKALHNVDSQNHIHQDHCHDGTIHPSLITIWPWLPSSLSGIVMFPCVQPNWRLRKALKSSRIWLDFLLKINNWSFFPWFGSFSSKKTRKQTGPQNPYNTAIGRFAPSYMKLRKIRSVAKRPNSGTSAKAAEKAAKWLATSPWWTKLALASNTFFLVCFFKKGFFMFILPPTIVHWIMTYVV